jgi:hypothetical protein
MVNLPTSAQKSPLYQHLIFYKLALLEHVEKAAGKIEQGVYGLKSGGWLGGSCMVGSGIVHLKE